MTTTIYKYPVDVGRAFVLPLPFGAELVHVGLDPSDGSPSIWFKHHTEAPKADRTFRAAMTGEPLGVNETHLGTIIWGPYVLHVMEVTHVHHL